MSINVDNIAHLARLSLTEQDTEKMQNDLSQILGLVEQISQVDTTDVAPLAHPLDLSQRLRSDDVTETNQRDLYLESAPSAEAGLFLVPQVIE